MSFLYQLAKIIGPRTPIIFWSNYKFLQSALSIRYAEYFSAKLCIHVISLSLLLYIFIPQRQQSLRFVDVNWIRDVCTGPVYFSLEFFYRRLNSRDCWKSRGAVRRSFCFPASLSYMWINRLWYESRSYGLVILLSFFFLYFNFRFMIPFQPEWSELGGDKSFLLDQLEYFYFFCNFWKPCNAPLPCLLWYSKFNWYLFPGLAELSPCGLSFTFSPRQIASLVLFFIRRLAFFFFLHNTCVPATL